MNKDKVGIIGAFITLLGFILMLYPIFKFIVMVYSSFLPGHSYCYLLGIIPIIIGNYLVTEFQK